MNPSPVLYITTSTRMSGAEFSLLRLMCALDRNKFQPILLLPQTGPFNEQAGKKGIETIILSQLIRFGESWRWHKVPKAVRAVNRLLGIMRSRNIRLLHANSPRAVYLAGLAARRAGVPVVTHVRDTHQSPFASPGKSRLLGFLSERIVAVSRAAADVVLSVNPALAGKTEVVYNGFDMQHIAETPAADIRAQWGLPATAQLIGSVATIHPSKGQDVLIRALARFRATHPQTRLLLIGELFHPGAAAFQADLERLVARSGLAQAVIFAGFRPDALSLIKGLDLFVHPAIIADSLPGALIEAAAAGKAIVASRVGGVAEIVAHGSSALLVEAGDADALAAAMRTLLDDSQLAQRLAVQARRSAHANFSLQGYVEGICRIYDQLLGGRT
jgi:glycosyltransferase involved in cell wall biosynthesis